MRQQEVVKLVVYHCHKIEFLLRAILHAIFVMISFQI